MSAIPAKVRADVLRLSGGRCEVMVTTAQSSCTGRVEHLHHKRLRSQGGANTTENLLAVCHACHGEIHRSVGWARANGYILDAAAMAAKGGVA